MSDNAQLQALLNAAGLVKFGTSTFMIDASKPLRMKARTVLDLSGTTLKVIPNSLDQHEVLVIDDGAGDLTIRNGTIIGDRDAHQGKSGDMGKGFGISIKRGAGAKIEIVGTVVTKMWGDGIYVSGGDSVTIFKVLCDSNRRQGMSIVNVVDLGVTGSTFSNTNGTRPEDGIDIEPNQGDVVTGLLISGNQFKDNHQAHIEIAGKRGTIHNVLIEKNVYSGTGVPLKINGVPEASKYQPSLTAQFRGWFGDYSGYPRTAKIA